MAKKQKKPVEVPAEERAERARQIHAQGYISGHDGEQHAQATSRCIRVMWIEQQPCPGDLDCYLVELRTTLTPTRAEVEEALQIGFAAMDGKRTKTGGAHTSGQPAKEGKEGRARKVKPHQCTGCSAAESRVVMVELEPCPACAARRAK